MRSLRTDEGMLPFMEKLATGRGAVSATEAANQVAAYKLAQGAKAGFLGAFKKGATETAANFGGRVDLTHELEAGARSAEAKQLQAMTDAMYNEAKASGVKELKHRQNYAPHYNTDEFEEFLGRARESGNFKRKGGPKGTGRLEARSFEPNTTYNINGVDVHLDTATIDDITTKFQAAFPNELGGAKLIEDDPAIWMSKLLEDHAADVATVGWEQRMRQGGSLVDEQSVMIQVPDKPATKAAEKLFIPHARNDINARKAQRTELTKAIREKVGGG